MLSSPGRVYKIQGPEETSGIGVGVWVGVGEIKGVGVAVGVRVGDGVGVGVSVGSAVSDGAVTGGSVPVGAGAGLTTLQAERNRTEKSSQIPGLRISLSIMVSR